MDKLLALRAFMDVAQTGGFSRAAQRRAVATSSVTRLIDGLEAALGVALLTRSTRRVTLTDAGSAYLEQVARLLSDLEEADASVSEGGSEAVGPLRVSVPVTWGRLCVGPHIAAFLRAHPRVSLELVSSDTPADLAAERIDVALRIGTPEHHPQLIVRPLAAHQRQVVASPGYLACHGTPARPQDLALHECLRFAYQPGPQRWSFLRDGQAQAVEVNGRLAANNADMLREAALDGFGIALLAQWLVEEDVRAGRLQRLFGDYAIDPQEHSVGIYAAYLPNRRHSRKVHAFVEFLQQHMPSNG